MVEAKVLNKGDIDQVGEIRPQSATRRKIMERLFLECAVRAALLVGATAICAVCDAGESSSSET